MEVICSSETSVATQQTTRRHIPEEDTLHNHLCENLKSYRLVFVLKMQCVFLVFNIILNFSHKKLSEGI
jgi:hypothetical protein